MNETMETVLHRSRTDEVGERLLKMARARGPGIKLPTIGEMELQFGVSRTTLERAMVKLETRGILRRKRGSGIYVEPAIRTKTIGVVFGGDIFSPEYSPFWSLLLQAVREQAGGRELVPRAYLDVSEGSGGLGGHAQLAEDLEARRLDGMLLLAPAYEHDEAAELRACGVPLVVFGGTRTADPKVTIDWHPLLRQAGAELARSGCRHVGLLASPAHRAILEQAFRQAGADDVRIDDWSYETWASTIPGAGNRENCAHRLTAQMIARRGTTPLPNALVSLEDTMTRGAVTALLQADLQPGRDIRIVSAENKRSPVLEPYAADIIRIAIDPQECMKAALDMLETLMDGRTPKENPVVVKGGGKSSR